MSNIYLHIMMIILQVRMFAGETIPQSQDVRQLIYLIGEGIKGPRAGILNKDLIDSFHGLEPNRYIVSFASSRANSTLSMD